jgi:hypothetical protein
LPGFIFSGSSEQRIHRQHAPQADAESVPESRVRLRRVTLVFAVDRALPGQDFLTLIVLFERGESVEPFPQRVETRQPGMLGEIVPESFSQCSFGGIWHGDEGCWSRFSGRLAQPQSRVVSSIPGRKG